MCAGLGIDADFVGNFLEGGKYPAPHPTFNLFISVLIHGLPVPTVLSELLPVIITRPPDVEELTPLPVHLGPACHSLRRLSWNDGLQIPVS